MTKSIFPVFLAILVSFYHISAQTAQSNEEKLKRKISSKHILNEASYYAPIRYVIVYNYIFNENQRRIKILMKPDQFNEKNLIQVFNLIKKRFPTPLYLFITVHTSLATIETPEEDEMTIDSRDSRFSGIKIKYKQAFFFRYYDGQEAFTYTTQTLPHYKEKRVFLLKSIN